MILLSVISLFIGCGDKEEENEAPELQNSSTAGCGDTAPVIQSVTCSNPGIQEHPDYGELPTFRLQANVTDADGDLGYYQILIDFDENLDGFESDDRQLDPKDGSVNAPECEAPEEGGSIDIGVVLYLRPETEPERDSRYEWFVRIADSVGNTSEPFMVTCTTPDDNGEGDPEQE